MSGSIEGIVNHIKYNCTFASSGQPTAQQFSLIRKAGYTAVINLAPYDLIEYPLKVLNKACEFYYTEQNTLACDRKQVQILPKIPK
jgi:hypothetical protein